MLKNMIKQFYKYLCYSVYRRALLSSKGISGIESKPHAYFNFLLLASITPLLILILKFGHLYVLNEKQRSAGIFFVIIHG